MSFRITRQRCALARLAATICLAILWSGSIAISGTIVGVGNDPPPPSGPFGASGTDEDPVMIGSLDEPVIITIDESPTAPPWMKQIELDRHGIGWATSGPNSMAMIMEVITIEPSSTSNKLPTDWHEDIDPSFGDGSMFKWAGGMIEFLPPSIGPFPGGVSSDGLSIWFEFPPVPLPITFKITKHLMWTGPIVTGADPQNDYAIKINERPSVPEPSSLAMAATGLIGLVVCLWRRKRPAGSR